LSLHGKTCLVTGATSGIGLATALAFARIGGKVIGVGRDPGRIASAGAAIAAEAALSGAPEPSFELADFSLMREVAALAGRLAGRGEPIHVLANVAGAFTARRVATAEGLETQFAVNHLAPFLLTTSLLPVMELAGGARVIIVASDSHYAARIRWSDPLMKRRYFGLAAYGQSKLANVLFSYELARRLEPGSGIEVFAADPGLANTDMGLKQGLSPSSLFWRLRRRAGTSPDLPAAAIAFLAASELVGGKTGRYWLNGVEKRSSRRSYDAEAARRLWELSEELCAALGPEARLPGRRAGNP
jgi:NAD(P)-dependent dehydrogenase (short-subunit alcohol dehydrogenase family)